jgi:MFS family permease
VVVLTILTHTAFNGSRVTVSLYAISLHATPLTIGTLMSIYALLPMLLAVAAGRLADRIGVRAPLIAAAAGVASGCALPYFWESLAALYVAAALIGTGFMVFHVAINSVVGGIGEAANRTQNFSVLAMGFSTSGFLGPLIAGFAIDHAGYTPSFLVLSLFPAITVAILAFGGVPLPGPQGGAVQRAGHRVIDLVKNPALRKVFISSGLLSMGWDLFSFMVPIYGARIHLSASMIGIVLGSFAAATFFVRLMMRFIARHMKEWQVLTAALGITAGTYFLFPLFENVYLLIALSFILGIGLGSAQPMVMSLLHNTAPPGRIGEAVGVRTTVMNTSHTLLPLLFGALGSLGMTPVFWAMALLLAGGSWFAARKRGGT